MKSLTKMLTGMYTVQFVENVESTHECYYVLTAKAYAKAE